MACLRSTGPVSRIRITVDRGSRIFILEDEQHRIDWFREKLEGCHLIFSSTYLNAVWTIANAPVRFDAMFLDHDLGLPERTGDGDDVAKHLAAGGYLAPLVVIHSWNPVGAQNMMNRIDTTVKAIVCPFGNFELEVR